MPTVLVTGSRGWSDHRIIEKWLQRCEVPNTDMTLIHGACRSGADAIADRFAKRRKWTTIERCEPDWKNLGKRAGPIRNRQMVQEWAKKIDWYLVFSQNKSSGTEHTLSEIRKCQDRKRGHCIVICRT